MDALRNSYAEMPVGELAPAPYNPNTLPAADMAQLEAEIRRQGREGGTVTDESNGPAPSPCGMR